MTGGPHDGRLVAPAAERVSDADRGDDGEHGGGDGTGSWPARLILRGAALLLLGAAAYLFGPRLVDLVEETPRLATIR